MQPGSFMGKEGYHCSYRFQYKASYRESFCSSWLTCQYVSNGDKTKEILKKIDGGKKPLGFLMLKYSATSLSIKLFLLTLSGRDESQT